MVKTPSPEVAHYRAKLASFSRSRSEDDPELLETKQALAQAKLTSDIERLVANAPALTTAQAFKLRSLLDVQGVK